MRTRITEIWATIIGGLWFLPTVMVVGSALLAIFTLWLDSRYASDWSTELGLIYSSSVVGGRELLSTIAGSMMTVTGVVFSITMVTLSLTSNQYGPRLLRNFLSDRGNQIVLGTFLGTFTYSLIILRTLQETGDSATAPEISIAVGATLALASLGVLIYFIHHISDSIQSTSILSAAGRDLDAAVERIFPERIGEMHRHPSDSVTGEIETIDGEPPHAITLGGAGYIRAIDADGLMNAAIAHDAILRLETRPGSFVYHGGRVGSAWLPDDSVEALEDDVRAAIVLGKSRTPFQDVGFLLSQLVQSALISLSSGVNNSLVAVTAIDWIGAALARVAERELPSAYRRDDEGRLRVIAEPVTFESMLDESFDPIRESSRGNTLVTLHLLDTIEKIAPHLRRYTDREALRRQADLIQDNASDQAINDIDRARINDRHREVVEVLAGSVRLLPESGSGRPSDRD